MLRGGKRGRDEKTGKKVGVEKGKGQGVEKGMYNGVEKIDGLMDGKGGRLKGW